MKYCKKCVMPDTRPGIKFNEEGIQKLVKLFNGDIKSLTNNLKGIIEAGRSYQSFSGLSDGMNGKVKFIIKTASIGE